MIIINKILRISMHILLSLQMSDVTVYLLTVHLERKLLILKKKNAFTTDYSIIFNYNLE